MHKIEKDFISNKSNVQVFHVCKRCGSLVGIVSCDVVCCHLNGCLFKLSVQESLKGGHFFLYLPLRQQLIDFCQNHNIINLMHKLQSSNFDSLSDIVNGKLYKQMLNQQESDSQLNLTLTLL